MGSKAKKPKEDPASIALRKRQTEQLLELDDEQNVRVRRMYNASTGMRSFRGIVGYAIAAEGTQPLRRVQATTGWCNPRSAA
jgi:hypothetical protein